jgi:hypothetical protein
MLIPLVRELQVGKRREHGGVKYCSYNEPEEGATMTPMSAVLFGSR